MTDGELDERFVHDKGVPFRVLDEQAVLVDPRRREVHRFNDTGTKIWTLLQVPHTVTELVADLAKEYDSSPAELEPEVRGFVAALVEMKLVLRVQTP